MIAGGWRILAALAGATAFLLGLAWCVAGCSGATEKRAEMAAKAAAYGSELNDCFADAASYPIYESCAEIVDKKYGRKP